MFTRLRSVPWLLAVIACATPLQNPYRSIQEPGTDAWTSYLAAKREWLALRSAPALDPEHARAAAAAVAGYLEAALVHSPTCPLFHSCLGDVRRSEGRDAEAREHHERALALCEDWVPGDEGLFWLALHEGRVADAAARLQRILYSLRSLADRGERGENAAERGPVDPLDPRLPKGRAHTLVLGWLFEAEQWHAGRAASGIDTAFHGGAGAVLQHRRARAWLLDFALLRAQEPENLTAQAEKLTNARGLDPDLWEAKFWQAILATEQHRWPEAHALLEGMFMGRCGPVLAADATVRDAFAQVCSEWYLETKADAEYDRALGCFRTIAVRWRGYARPGDRGGDPFLFAAQELILGCSDHSPRRLRAARDVLLDWHPEPPRDVARRESLLAEINDNVRAAAKTAQERLVR